MVKVHHRLERPVSHIKTVIGMGATGGLVALALGSPVLLPGFAAAAQVVQVEAGEVVRSLLPEPEPFDPATLFKADTYTYEVADTVSTTPLRQSTVRKIGYGQTEFVQVVETASGTYSSDGLESPYVQYPGITKQRSGGQIGLALWADGGWVVQNALTAGSFVTITRFEGGQLVVTDEGMCVTSSSGITCN
jgi:hypothetical protein